MKKSTFIGLIVGIIVATAVLKNSSYKKCSNHMIKIADKICEFRHDKGRWPYTENEIVENSETLHGMEFKTLYGKPISYDPGELSLYSECPHGKMPAHGFNFAARYEETY